MAGFKIHNFDLSKLLEFASTAKGEVYLKTADGDSLNLKSRLTQLLALSSAVDWGNVGEATVVCSDPMTKADCSVLIFMAATPNRFKSKNPARIFCERDFAVWS